MLRITLMGCLVASSCLVCADDSKRPTLTATMPNAKIGTVHGMLATLARHRMNCEGKLKQIYSECGSHTKKYAEAYRRYTEAAGAANGVLTYLRSDASPNMGELKSFADEAEEAINRFYEIEFIDCNKIKKQGVTGEMFQQGMLQGLMGLTFGQLQEWFNKKRDEKLRRDQMIVTMEWRDVDTGLKLALPNAQAGANYYAQGQGTTPTPATSPSGGATHAPSAVPAAAVPEKPELILEFMLPGAGMTNGEGKYEVPLGTTFQAEFRSAAGTQSEFRWGAAGTELLKESLASGEAGRSFTPTAVGPHVFVLRVWNEQGQATRQLEVVVRKP